MQWSVSGDAPFWFHLVNLLLHALATALVVLVALRWLTPPAALVAGLVFATHAVHVEAVANVVGRAEILSALGMLAAVLAACGAAVGNDSGLTHLASVVGCPTVALFGPTDPARTAPVGRAVVLRAGAPDGSRSLAGIAHGDVTRAVVGLLARGDSGPGTARAAPGPGPEARS